MRPVVTAVDADIIADEILEEILSLTGGDPELLREAEQVILRTAYLEADQDGQDR